MVGELLVVGSEVMSGVTVTIIVGKPVGDLDGILVGKGVGDPVIGDSDGESVGESVIGDAVGTSDIILVSVGAADGSMDGD